MLTYGKFIHNIYTYKHIYIYIYIHIYSLFKYTEYLLLPNTS